MLVITSWAESDHGDVPSKRHEAATALCHVRSDQEAPASRAHVPILQETPDRKAPAPASEAKEAAKGKRTGGFGWPAVSWEAAIANREFA